MATVILKSVEECGMVTYEQYETLGDIPQRYRKRLNDILHDSEEFVLAIDTKSGRFRSKHNTKLVLTNQRVIRMKSGMVRSKTEDYSLEDITSIQFNRGIRKSELKLQGSAIDDTYSTTKRHGQAFVSAARERMAEQ